ncbi:MAG: M16 family metallopeptidase [Xanthobacteraceae bacterium]
MTASESTWRNPAAAARALVLVVAAWLVTSSAQAATSIERVISPGGIEVWLVHEPSLPLVAIDFSFSGGSSQAPPEKAGLASMVADLLDEGAGDLDSRAFHEKVENYAISLGFSASRDNFSGSLRTLAEHQDVAFDLLRLSLTSPRFDSDVVERIRSQKISGLRRATMSPNELANRRWWETAFPGHPYAAPVTGTLETLPAITAEDLTTYVRKIFAKNTLKIGIVGNVNATEAGSIVDRIFGGLPAKANLVGVPEAQPQIGDGKVNIDIDVPQTVVIIGGAGIPRKDPDFITAYVLNHILGGGSFSSRLYREVREVRGLAYSVYSTLLPLDRTALFVAGTATRSDRAEQSLDVIMNEIHRMAMDGPSAEELADAKSFLKGSFALRFDTSSKIASQLVQMQVDDLGIDYIEKRNGLIDAVTLPDIKRVAKRLLDTPMLVAVAGRTKAAVATGSSTGAPAAAAPAASAPAKRDGG